MLLAAIDPVAAAESYASHAEKWPITVGFFSLLIGFIALLIAAGFFLHWLAQVGWPAYLAQQERNVQSREAEGEKTRKHIADLMAGRDAAAAAAITDAHSKIGAKVEEVHQDVKDLHSKHDKLDTVLRTIAIKVGASLFLLLAGSFGLGYGSAMPGIGKPAMLAISCAGIGGCRAPEFCCATDTCCRNAGDSVTPSEPSILPAASPTQAVPVAPAAVPTIPAPAAPAAPAPQPRPTRERSPQSYYVRVDYGDDPFAASRARL